MARLARSVAHAQSAYDAVVIGSGYGGGVAASRLARIGLRVAVLERGREILPGEFAQALSDAPREVQIGSKGHRVGARDALFDLRVGADIHALVGCGLGGTSLINANVCMTPDVLVLEDEAWPEAMRIDHRLNVGFHRARQMLSPEPLPPAFAPAKLDALDVAGKALGREMERPPLHVAFEARKNAAGVVQPACTQCGDCMAGCNVGAKTTVHATYLTDAVNHGAELFTGALVRVVERAEGDLWRVVYQRSDDGKTMAPVGAVTAAVVVIAAGTLGTAEILMRSRAQGLPLSDRLGQRFSSNADMIAFSYNQDRPADAVGIGHPPRARAPAPGPAVAGMIDLRRRRDPLDRIAIVEAAVPRIMAGIMPMLLAAGSSASRAGDGGLAELIASSGRAARTLASGAYKGAVNHSMALLAVGHDPAGGHLEMDGDEVAIRWPGIADEPVFTHISATLRRVAAANKGTFVANPMSARLLGGAPLTVHPLGGCIMGNDRDHGVVDHRCRVFDGNGARPRDAVHEGLYICDGSVVPRPLGIHPLLTITAIAERAMLLFARDHGLRLDTTPRADAPVRSFHGGGADGVAAATPSVERG